MTLIQQLFNELEQMHPSLFDIHTAKGREFVNHFHKYIQLEKQQIIDAASRACQSMCYNDETSAKQYYNDKYGQ